LTITEKIELLADKYRAELKKQIDKRVKDMEQDDHSHFLVYQVLGITDKEGRLIDIYQNKGRFLYKYAGSFLEAATRECFAARFPKGGMKRLPNTIGKRPKTFEIDFVEGANAIEIKWRDATTDGDHITKEHTRIQVISNAGYKPVRIMFYYPNRDQAKRIQEAIKTMYKGVKGQYYFGDDAWSYVKKQTGIDLKLILEEIARANVKAQKDA